MQSFTNKNIKEQSVKENSDTKLSNKKTKHLGNFSSLINDLNKIDTPHIEKLNNTENVINFDINNRSAILKKTQNNIFSDVLLDDDNGLLEKTDLNQYLLGLVSEFEDYEGGKITMNIDKNIPYCLINRPLTKIILNNILSNAFKYSLGKVNIYLSVSLCNSIDRQWINFAISDSGIGMSAEQIKNIYVPFYRGEPSGYIPGNGVGMFTVKKIIDKLNGSIDIVSRIGNGTTVNVKLEYFSN
jgi:signal transduction histidine kinase